MIIICTGISGSGRSQVISSMVNYARTQGINIQVKNVGRMMYEKAEEGGFSIDEGKILDLPEFTLRSLRWSVFEDILGTLDDEEHTIIDTHACFRWKKYMFDGFDYSYISRLNPDIYINIMDTIYPTKGRLELQESWRGRLNLLELLIWRNEEEVLTRTFARIQNKNFYLLFFEDPPELMYRICFKRNIKKAYLSYPISFATPEQIKVVQDFRDDLRKDVIVFDPLGIRDIGWQTAALSLEKQGKREIEIPFRIDERQEYITIPVKDMHQVHNYLVDQTVSRDFTLIDQSDFIVVDYYDPEIHSPGVNNEMQYAHDNGKDVFIYWPDTRMSPFLERNITQHFRNKTNLITFLQKL